MTVWAVNIERHQRVAGQSYEKENTRGNQSGHGWLGADPRMALELELARQQAGRQPPEVVTQKFSTVSICREGNCV